MRRTPRLSAIRLVGASAAALTVAASAHISVGAAQHSVPFRNGIPVAPDGLTPRLLPLEPMTFETAEGQDIRVVALTRSLEYPWAMAFLPDGSVLITERFGQLRIVRNGTLDPQPVGGVPESYGAGQSGLPGAVHGLMDIALHPRFAENQWVYLTYTKPLGPGELTVAVARGTWTGSALEDVEDVFQTGAAGTSRIAFGRDGKLYLSTTGVDPQDPNTLGGKVLRLNDDGSVPEDNPFVGRPGHRPEVYTLGHRSALGLAVHPVTGEMWEHENGPNGGDELNILHPGANYGWPLVSLGRDYKGPWQSEQFQRPDFESPIVYWTPSIAVSGLAFYTGDRLPRWKGDVFVGALRYGEIPGTGHLQRILFNENMEELRREMLLYGLRQRIRDVRQGPDGLLYLLTDEQEGALLRIEPAS